jgi:hypothetical protein
MRRKCDQCGLRYNDEHCSTICPHKGIGYCAVCDSVICVCTPETAGDWERSQANPSKSA